MIQNQKRISQDVNISIISFRIFICFRKEKPAGNYAGGTKPQYKTLQLKLMDHLALLLELCYLRFIFTISPRVVSFFI
jgi:hypothetical protein